MKIQPIAQGAIPNNLEATGQTASPDKIARAKMIASGQIVPADPAEQVQAQPESVNDKLKKIKMTTQRSTNRHEIQPPAEAVQQVESTAVETTNATADNIIEPVVEDTKPLSPQFAALARQRRALQVKEREIAQREEALKAQAPVEVVDWKANLKANPLSVLQEAGVTYDQLTEAILANQNGQNIDVNAIRAQITEDVTKKLTEQLTERDSASEQQVLANMAAEVKNLTAQGDEYEAIRLAGQQQAVVDLIHRTWKQNGEILDVKEAADLVENQLIDEAIPFAKSKKVQSRLTPAQEEAQAAAQTSAAQPKPGVQVMRTITNRVSSMAAPLDRRSRALAAWNNAGKR